MNEAKGPKRRKLAVRLGALLAIADFSFAVFQYSPTPSSKSVDAKIAISNRLFDDARSFGPSIRNPALRQNVSPASEKSAELSVMDKNLCRIKKNSSVPVGGDLRVQTNPRIDGARDYWLKSSNCPDELYSIVVVDRSGRIEKEINCQNTNLTEVTINSGLQFNVKYVAPDPLIRAVALSGAGRMLVNCFDGNLTLSRDGKFFSKSKSITNSEGCVAWTLKDGGRAVNFSPDEILDDRGCSRFSGECLEIYDVDASDKDAYNFKTKNSLTVLNERGLVTDRTTIVYNGALEDLDSNDRSLTGVANWEMLAPTIMPVNCPD